MLKRFHFDVTRHVLVEPPSILGLGDTGRLCLFPPSNTHRPVVIATYACKTWRSTEKNFAAFISAIVHSSKAWLTPLPKEPSDTAHIFCMSKASCTGSFKQVAILNQLMDPALKGCFYAKLVTHSRRELCRVRYIIWVVIWEGFLFLANFILWWRRICLFKITYKIHYSSQDLLHEISICSKWSRRLKRKFNNTLSLWDLHFHQWPKRFACCFYFST